MELTRIGRENEAPFAPLMGGKKSEDYALCVGAIEEGEAALAADRNFLSFNDSLSFIKREFIFESDPVLQRQKNEIYRGYG